MRVEIIVALTAAGSALVISLVSGIYQLLQIRANHRLQLRRDVEQDVRRLSGESFKESQDALREACKALQHIQDELLLLVKAAPDSLLSKTQRTRLLEARNHLLRVYQDYHPLLGERDRNNLNESRKRTVDMVLRLDLERIWDTTYPVLNESLIVELSRTSVTLGHYHQQLLFSYVNNLNLNVTETRGFLDVKNDS